MSKIRNDAHHVLERMRVEGLPRAYVLGCHAQRVTVLSQQFRAFNLVWALFDQRCLKEGDRVGVVGGGIGGLTVGAAAMLKGCRLVLTEERQQLMHLQRRNTTRFLHPNIYEWPREGAEEESTPLPCMNWSADIAGQVVARLDDEWRDLVAEYHPEVHTETRVTALRATADGRLILASEHWESDPCDVVVVAVGFGVEPPASGLSLDSYWENDKLEQSVRGAQPLKRYLVSGLGDGACIDVLRLTYANFDHGRFAMAIARLNDLQRLKRPLVGIDLRMPDTGQVEYLRTQYERLSFPPNLATQLGTFRTDTYVLLNGPDPAPLSPRACILHRVAIWSLVLASKLVYRPGRLDVGGIEPRSVSTGLRYLVPLPGVGGKNAFDGVIIRHGPIACLGALPAIATAYRAIRENPAKDRTRTKRYPDGFYPEPRSRRPTGDGQPPSVARALAGDVWFKDTLTPHLACGASAGVIEAPGLRAALAVPPSSAIAEVQALIQTLKEETRAQNFPEASEAAGLLEGLIMRHGGSLGRQTWDAANTALWDCELLVRERVMAGGGTYDMGRLRELVERIEHGHP